MCCLDEFFHPWAPHDIIKLRRLSSAVFYAIESYIAYAWDVERVIGRWFFDTRAFRKALDAANGVISGSEALSFFSRTEFRGNDLDLYVPLHGLIPLGRYLDRVGYDYQPSACMDPCFDTAALTFAACIAPSHESSTPARTLGSSTPGAGTLESYAFSPFNFVHSTTDWQGQVLSTMRVQLIGVRGDPVEHIINSFHSSMYHITLPL